MFKSGTPRKGVCVKETEQRCIDYFLNRIVKGLPTELSADTGWEVTLFYDKELADFCFISHDVEYATLVDRIIEVLSKEQDESLLVTIDEVDIIDGSISHKLCGEITYKNRE